MIILLRKLKEGGYRMTLDFNFIQNLIGLQDIKIEYINVINGMVNIYAESKYNFAVCPKCKKIAQDIHDRKSQAYRHLPICDKDTVLHLNIKRYKWSCDVEHPFTENFTFIRKYQRQTIAFEQYIFDLCKKNTIENVTVLLNLSHDKVQRILNYYANSAIACREKTTPIYLGIDDIAVRKGHNYLTVIYNQETKSIIDIIKGRTKVDVTKSLNLIFTADERLSVKAVSIDMSKAFAGAITECFPNADIVIDRFHISQHLHKQVDVARKHIQNKIRKEENNKQKVFKIRWSLLKNFEDLTSKELDNLLKVCDKYPKLGECLALKELFREFFTIKTKEEASAFIDYFSTIVEESDIPELKIFCKTLNNWCDKILNFYDHFISNGFVEGMNHKVKNIKRRAFNYRNDSNFKIRVLHECG